MNREWRDKWCAALRSGEYKKTTGQLREGDCQNSTYCAMGVLAAIMRPEPEHWNGVYFVSHGEKYDAGLPRDLLREAGLSSFEQSDIIELNDEGDPEEESYPLTFNEIADWIEENL